jgi:hypothetical protein
MPGTKVLDAQIGFLKKLPNCFPKGLCYLAFTPAVYKKSCVSSAPVSSWGMG